MLFFFIALPVGFGVVSVFDALYDRMAAPPSSAASATDQGAS